MANDASENAGQFNGLSSINKRIVLVSALVLVIGFMAADLVYVNIALIHKYTPTNVTVPILSFTTPTPTSAPSANVALNPSLVSSSPTPIQSGTTLTPTFTPTPTSMPTPTPVATPKDYFIPLGTGETQASDWSDVPGDQVSVNFGQYPHIKQILFEVSVTIPSGSEWVSVRLFNETDMHPVWDSTVTSAGNVTSAVLTSSPIIYDTGMKTYQVQMQTQLQAPANLVQSRIHIILQ